jgi:hypothetical protein
VEDDLKKAGQTETIKKARVKKAKQNMAELIELQQKAGDLGRARRITRNKSEE